MDAIDTVMSAEAIAKKENKLSERAKYLEMVIILSYFLKLFINIYIYINNKIIL